MFGQKLLSWLRPEMYTVGKQEDNMADSFPYQLDDIKAWVIKRKDGVTVRYSLIPKDGAAALTTKAPAVKQASFYSGSSHHFSEWCSHTPSTSTTPIFSNGKISLWIADAAGARKSFTEFDVCIDGGNVLTVPGEHDLPNLYGDPGLSKGLMSHAFRSSYEKEAAAKTTKILKVRWADRCPPPVYASFWPALLSKLEDLQKKLPDGQPLKVLTICQGGHGRSGSALVALMMCMTDYSPLDALTHIRALHCARAIESKDQHVYLNILAKHLGREENALEAENVKSFKDRFLTLTSPTALLYKDRVKAGKGALVDERDGGYL